MSKQEIVETFTHLMPEKPLEDGPTREYLIRMGFDLAAPITWWDNEHKTLRYFRQNKSRGLLIK
jgi:hypothetical protein